MDRFGSALLSTATGNLTREFWPDIRRLFRRHSPKKVKDIEQQIEQKMPAPLRPGLSQ